ncbi:2-amino-3-carboxymuconate-6-semialdehyde decarboxylase [Drechslerella dactyloides]|uniref:2-amino-3-carboxymuconate-6-semialdehyde decarboxylase n=1 Tax=Drechslerella dactyloides TaxID=74499 RepID=A0AAD6J0H9_DREDA|nr:2-amino-3-carboxymuconate-6-semialdehyde decarboxylase [Drechslerella dactyloides]
MHQLRNFAMSKVTIVDVHTHVYPPRYVSILKSRTTVPYVRDTTPGQPSRLIILPGEDSPSSHSTAAGRPIGPEYYDINAKIAFMDTHGIDVSVISLANPWLDFLDPREAAAVAREINYDLDSMCKTYPGRLFAFGALPLSGTTDVIVNEIERLPGYNYMRGVIMGTGGLGNGLDDLSLDPVYRALEANNMTIFLHPHYGLPKEVFGPRAAEYGHVLPLALGFPLETTVAVSRMILSGVFDRFPKLQVLLAHSGGTLPFLAGRLESCIAHDAHYRPEGRRSIWDVLKVNIMLDAVVYSELGVRAAAAASGGDRVLFGTDHPFFPPLEAEEDAKGESADGKQSEKWLSVTTNYKAIRDAFSDNNGQEESVLGGNAIRLLRLA